MIRTSYSAELVGLFGAEGSAGYDLQASFARFELHLTQVLKKRYPEAEVSVREGGDSHSVNGLGEDHPEAAWIGQLVHDVWVTWEW